MSKDANPYVPSTDRLEGTKQVREPSTWRRNLGSLGFIVSIYCLITLVHAVTRRSLLPNHIYTLLLIAILFSTWANFQLGPFILIVGWAVVYLVACLVGAGVVY